MRAPGRSISLGLVTLLILLASSFIAYLWIGQQKAVRTDLTYSAAKAAFHRGNHAEALSICRELLTKQRDSPKLLLMAGESASRLKQYDEAIELYDRIPDSAGSDAAIARWAAGEVALQMGQMSVSMQRMEQSLALDAGMDQARDRLIYLFNLSGRRWDAFPHLFAMVQQNRWSVQHLLYLGNIAMPVENEKELKGFLTASPHDRMPLLGLARIRLRAGATAEAGKLLSDLLEQSPNLVEAHVQLGKLLQQVDPDKIVDWNRSLPATAETHPMVWLIRGEWARDHGQPEAAARCFAESVRLDPDHLAAVNALTQSLGSLGQSERAKSLMQRATKLEKLSYVFERIMSNEWTSRRAVAEQKLSTAEIGQTMRSKGIMDPIVAAAQQTFDLGRFWESMAWCQYGLSFDPAQSELRRIAELSRPKLDRQTTRTLLEKDLIDIRWVQTLKLPDWKITDSRSPSLADKSDHGARTIRFTDLGEELDFTYYSSRTVFEDGRRMFEMTGGGVGVLDYDHDGWPDLFLAQGCDWPPGSESEHSDRLKRNVGMRNSGVKLFEDVTDFAGVREHAFGQGVAIGDVDSDGFDDVYVCNFGVNQLWLNQGDGTFRDGSSCIEPLPPQWTVSAAIADLNNDGLAEIVDANYVEGDDVTTRRCLLKGIPRACSPLNFRPSKGRLLSVDETGLFGEIAEPFSSGSIHSGNALGLVVFRLKDQSLPSIFIANDQVANLMLIPIPDASSSLGVRYEDHALLSGLAYDGEGKAQACMGVAAGDTNRDGAMDLLVTNYFDETNTLYLQEPNGIFRDATRSSGLVAPSLKMLGFGTQFLDAQNDGEADLVVLNGHIDDMTHAGMGYRMRSQFFLGNGQSRWMELAPNELGPYFERERLGRALALIDFNRDGRQDFAATDLEGPTSLVRNDSQSGNYLTIRLVGTKSHRDAIGTNVIVTVAGNQRSQQLVSGCGYMATNEKILHFGLGSAEQVDRIELDWPSGTRETYSNVQVNTHWIAIENMSLTQP